MGIKEDGVHEVEVIFIFGPGNGRAEICTFSEFLRKIGIEKVQ